MPTYNRLFITYYSLLSCPPAGALLPGADVIGSGVGVNPPRRTVVAGKRLSATPVLVTREQPGGYRTRCAARLVARIIDPHNQWPAEHRVFADRTWVPYSKIAKIPAGVGPAVKARLFRHDFVARIPRGIVRGAPGRASSEALVVAPTQPVLLVCDDPTLRTRAATRVRN